MNYETGHQQARELCIYIAGLMDGEGSFCMTRNMPRGSHHNIRYTPNVCLGMTNQPTTEKFKLFLEMFGIKYYETKRISPEPYLPVYTFTVRRLTYAKKALELLIPFLVGKKRQAELLLEFINSRMDKDGNVIFRGGKGLGVYSQRTHDIWLEVRTLNGKGRPKGDVPRSERSIQMAEQLSRLNDYTSPLRYEHTPVVQMKPTEDIVSSAIESCSNA